VLLRVTMTPAIVLELTRIWPVLSEVLHDALDAYPFDELFIPNHSIYRPFQAELQKSRSGYHGMDDLDNDGHRCIDIPTPTWEIAEDMAAVINPKWIYDPDRRLKLVAYAAKHGTGPHCHLQVHPNTVRRTNAGLEA